MREYDFKLVVVVTVSTLVLILEHYHSIPLQFPEVTQIVYYLLIPLSISFLLFKEKPSDYGIRLGNWKLALASIVICLSIMAVVIYAVAHLQAFKDYYRLSEDVNLGRLFFNAALYFFAWEFLFRGYMLFGLEKSIGRSAIFVQAIPFALLHIGKPQLEALTALFGGFILGYIGYRTRSFLPCFFIHLGIYIMMRVFAGF
jgi:membrane protease YdiL (CAAX protease family)